jgi:ribosomal protein S18 acetylase RimI-like enzyme
VDGNAVRKATEADIPAMSSTLAASLMDDPVTCWLFPSSERRRRMATRFFAWTLETVSMPLGEVWTVDDCSAVALWNPPDQWRLGLLDQVRLLPTAMSLFRQRTFGILLGFNQLESKHPDAPPHWYLYFIGTRPELQGRGLGGALLAHMLDRADGEGVPAYLEASTPRVVPFYSRHGFRELERFALKGGPDWSLMWRDPR